MVKPIQSVFHFSGPSTHLFPHCPPAVCTGWMKATAISAIYELDFIAATTSVFETAALMYPAASYSAYVRVHTVFAVAQSLERAIVVRPDLLEGCPELLEGFRELCKLCTEDKYANTTAGKQSNALLVLLCFWVTCAELAELADPHLHVLSVLCSYDCI